MTIIIISWDSIDSVLLCFKYPSLYTHTYPVFGVLLQRERRGNGILNFVKILNQNFSRVTNLNKEET